MWSGTVRSNLDPFGEYGGDHTLWEALRDVGLEDQVRGGGGGLGGGVQSALCTCGRAARGATSPGVQPPRPGPKGRGLPAAAWTPRLTAPALAPTPPPHPPSPLSTPSAPRLRPAAAWTPRSTAPAATRGPSASSSSCASRARRSRRRAARRRCAALALIICALCPIAAALRRLVPRFRRARCSRRGALLHTARAPADALRPPPQVPILCLDEATAAMDPHTEARAPRGRRPALLSARAPTPPATHLPRRPPLTVRDAPAFPSPRPTCLRSSSASSTSAPR